MKNLIKALFPLSISSYHILFVLASLFILSCNNTDNSTEEKPASYENLKYRLDSVPSINILESSLNEHEIAYIEKNNIGVFTPSPTWDDIAYSTLIHHDEEGDYCQIRHFNISTKNDTVMLDTSASKKYATYGSYPFSIDWKYKDTISVGISDGDVDYAHIKLSVSYKDSVYSTVYGSAGDDYGLTKKDSAWYRKLTKVFSKFDSSAIDDMIRNSFDTISSELAIGQFNFNGYDENIRLFDFKNNVVTTILSLPERRFIHGFVGTQLIDENIIFALSDKSLVHIYQFNTSSKELKEVIVYSYKNAQKLNLFKIKEKNTYFVSVTSSESPILLLEYKNGTWNKVKTNDELMIFEPNSSGKKALMYGKKLDKWFISLKEI
jgi:hypothetical protein